MGQFTINYPDANAADLRDTLCIGWGYEETIDGQPNPETKANFIRRQIAEYVKRVYVNTKGQQEALTAEQTAKTAASLIDIN